MDFTALDQFASSRAITRSSLLVKAAFLAAILLLATNAAAQAVAKDDIINQLSWHIPPKISSAVIKWQVDKHGINFVMDEDLENKFRKLHASDELLMSLRRESDKLQGTQVADPGDKNRPPPATAIDPQLADRAREDPAAMVALGSEYEQAGNSQEAVNCYRKAADAGNAQGMYNLGDMYRHWPKIRDYPQAIEWYLKAAEAGVPRGWTSVGAMYQYADGAEKDCQQAISLYSKAAEAGDPLAMVDMGIFYEKGCDEVPLDYKQAVDSFRKAADAVNASEKVVAIASYHLGSMYENGRGVETDLQQARTWYRKAAQLGNQDATDNLKRLGESP